MKNHLKISTLFLFFSLVIVAQQNSIAIKSILNPENDVLQIQQEIVFHNTSDSIFKRVFLHNWPNSFKDRKTPLSKRFVEDFRKDLYFAKKEKLGFTVIKNLSVNFENVPFKEVKNHSDIMEVFLKKDLKPNDSITISVTYSVKIPSAKFTGYGKTKNGYHLRFWHLTPAVFTTNWQLMSNLNTDDLYQKGTDYSIEINVPKKFVVESNLYQYETKKENSNHYYLVGKNKTDIILSIHQKKQFKTFNTKFIAVHTDIFNDKLSHKQTATIFNRELLFIKKYLGEYPHKEIYIDKITQRKNPVFGLSQLPSFIRPFSNTFKWDLTMFKVIAKKYIENTLLLNKRKDYWLIDGLQSYLMMEYVNEFYPETKLAGTASKVWGIRSFNLAKLEFNDKYPFIYQFSARKFLDQSLTTSSDSLSNFNRRIVNKYKAGLGLRYLKGYLGASVLNSAIKEFYQKNQLKITSSKTFGTLLSKKTNKDLSWFFGDYIHTNKKIDYVISNVKEETDSIQITIKNRRNITAPVALYGLKNKQVTLKKWITNIENSKTIKVAKGNFNKFSLNYENLYPEYNTLNNWKTLEKKIFNKPLKFTLLKDAENPYYNQLFYQPKFQYNLYDGLILGVKLHNKPLIKRNLEFEIEPSYATKSKSIVGNFSVIYNQFFEDTDIYKITYGVAGSTQHYAPELSYSSLIPFVNVTFKRKSLREASLKSITAKLVHINKEVLPQNSRSDQDRYDVFSLRYRYNRANIIKEFGYSFNTEFAKKFSKVSFDIRYRNLTSKNTQLDFRIFAGAFLNNKTEGNYFSFGLDRSNDYLFQLNYYGRSESSGFFSQQFILTEGGFKSVLSARFANQFMLSFNSSIGIWRWVEFYTDVAFLKNKNQNVFFGYENGVRFNFVNNILELYFPFYSNNGWELSQNAYPEKIRFTLTLNPNAIYNFFRRGFL
ncbi:MAG: aminopeptidase [Polaribacter sp.]